GGGAAQWRCIFQAGAEGRRFRDGRGGRAADAPRRWRVRAGGHRPDERRAHADQSNASRSVAGRQAAGRRDDQGGGAARRGGVGTISRSARFGRVQERSRARLDRAGASQGGGASARTRRARPQRRRTEVDHARPALDQRREARGGRRASPPAGPSHPRRPAADRAAHRLRHAALRSVPRAAAGGAREGVDDVRGAGQRQEADDGRRARAERQAASAAGRLHGRARPAVRLLHARHADDRVCVSRHASHAVRGRDSRGDLRQSLPLHRLREHRQGRATRSGHTAGGRRAMNPKTSPEVSGMGHSMKRKEDPRFIRGKGTYVDDVQLPGMLWLDIVRSPHAHAKIVKIDPAKALATPGVLAVITGKDLEKYNLHWMPTLMSDTQMVLPVDKVMYQAQEVAAVLATSRYAAADGAAAVGVEYEPLPVVVDPKKALEPGAPVLRTDKKDKKDNHIWHWEWGDRAATDRAFTEADVTVKQDIYIPRIHVASIETCGCVAHFDKVNDKLTVWMTTQAPHAIRTVFALVAGHVGL